MRFTLADGVNLSRLLLLVPWVGLYAAGSGLALAVMAAIVATDLVDGPLARRLHTEGPRGRLLDAGCDAAVVVTAGLAAGVSDARYLLLPGLAVVCVASWFGGGARAGCVRYTRLGRHDGAACYMLLLFMSAGPLLPLRPGLRWTLEWVALCGLGLLLGASTAENLLATEVRARRAGERRRVGSDMGGDPS